jgi:transcription-repair coupling factor (superfamily II helicase)
MFEGEEIPTDYPDTKVEFDLSAYLDNDYVQDNVERLNLYRKLSEAANEEQINEWKEELTDRFGELPESGKNLLKAAQIKLLGSRSFFTKITVRADRMWLVCPSEDSKYADKFYESGLFQETLKKIQSQSSHPCQVVQKKNHVTFVIKNIADTSQAINYLKSLNLNRVAEAEPAS